MGEEEGGEGKRKRKGALPKRKGEGVLRVRGATQKSSVAQGQRRG